MLSFYPQLPRITDDYRPYLRLIWAKPAYDYHRPKYLVCSLFGDYFLQNTFP